MRWGERVLGQPFHDNWWQTETGGILIANPPGEPVEPGSMGRPLPGVEVAIVREEGGVITPITEPDVEGDPFEVSDADTMLRYLDPDARAEQFVSLFTRPGCRHCERARKLLDEHGVEYEEIVLDGRLTTRSLRAVTGADSVPQVFIDGRRVGGADELEAYFA